MARGLIASSFLTLSEKLRLIVLANQPTAEKQLLESTRLGVNSQ